jgi:hypothetical protein
MVLDGRIRIPTLARGFAWERRDVLELLDSVYRGFPIGTLLFQRAPAEAAEVRVGPLAVMATERPDALWVVDGQQRLTSLAIALGRPGPVPPTPEDPFTIYFDTATESFQSPPEDGPLPSTWAPLPSLLETPRLEEWLRSWPHREDAALRARAVAAGRRLREQRVPVYTVRTSDEELLRTIFVRLNGGGRSLAWSDLREGLVGRASAPPTSLDELVDELTKLGMGRLEDSELLPCLAALHGRSEDLLEARPQSARAIHDRDAAAALPILRKALGFLRSDCRIPHLRLLPYPVLLTVLTRFFQAHPEPNERTRTLLTRWIWRMLLAPEHDARALLRAGMTAVVADEEASVQSLLQLAPTSQPPLALDARVASRRLALLGLASLNPVSLAHDSSTIDVAALIRARGDEAARPLFELMHEATRGPANRLLLPGEGPADAEVRAFIAGRGRHGRHGLAGLDDPILRSHAIDASVAEAILDGDVPRALARRAALLASSVQSLGDRLAEWGRTDRPSLEYLMRLASA